MQFSSVILAALMGSAALAAPIAELEKRSQVWTIQRWTRTCNGANTSCNYSYTINPNDGTTTPCSYTISAPSNASRAGYSNVRCGQFSINSGFTASGNSGFTVMPVSRNGLIAFPAYSEQEITNGIPVTPDKSYTAGPPP